MIQRKWNLYQALTQRGQLLGKEAVKRKLLPKKFCIERLGSFWPSTASYSGYVQYFVWLVQETIPGTEGKVSKSACVPMLSEQTTVSLRNKSCFLTDEPFLCLNWRTLNEGLGKQRWKTHLWQNFKSPSSMSLDCGLVIKHILGENEGSSPSLCFLWMLQARRVWGPGEGKTSEVHPGSLGLLSPGTEQSAGGIGWLSNAVLNRLWFSTQLQDPFYEICIIFSFSYLFLKILVESSSNYLELHWIVIINTAQVITEYVLHIIEGAVLSKVLNSR